MLSLLSGGGGGRGRAEGGSAVKGLSSTRHTSHTAPRGTEGGWPDMCVTCVCDMRQGILWMEHARV